MQIRCLSEDFGRWVYFCIDLQTYKRLTQARNQDFMWGGANEAKADPTTEMYFLSSDPFIQETSNT